MRKFFCLFFAILMLMSTTVFAFSSDEKYVVPVEEITESSSKGTCYLGHWFTTTVHMSVGTSCVNHGDSACYYNCYEGKKCTNCGTIVSETYLHYHAACHQNGMHYSPYWS